MSNPFKRFIIYGLLLTASAGCNKYLDTALPAGTISGQNAYVSDNSVSAVVTTNFISLSNSGLFTGGTGGNVAYLTGLYTDELQNFGTSAANNIAFYRNNIQYGNVGFWSDLYSKIFVVNSTLEGIQKTSAQLYYKNQWLGETYFIRAFLYFYLTNLYGDVPLALTSDYATNNTLHRAPQSQVYQQIVADLKQAQSLLNRGYTDGFGSPTTHRVRPNRYAATALLAKTYLYREKWDSAATQADSVIAQTNYSLMPLAQAFASNNAETIWAFAPLTSSAPVEYGYYNNGMPSPIVAPNTTTTYNVLAVMDSVLVKAFESGDNRFNSWIRAVPVTGSSPAVTYYLPNKYASSAVNTTNDIVLRTAEIYLIRAEARAHLNNITGAQADLNAVRTRAGLPNTTAADQASLLAAIARERRVELFTEFANRFLDLKRTKAIDTVMAAFAPLKGSTWSSFMQLMPIPTNDLIQNPNLTPNPGYQQ